MFSDYFAGFVTTATPEAASYFVPPDPPSNYKRPEAIAEYQEKAREAFLEKAALQGVTGSLVAAHIIGLDGSTTLSLADERPGHVAVGLIRFLVEQGFDDYPATVGGSFTPKRRLWGLDIDKFLRIAGLEALRCGSVLGVQHIPLRVWHNNNGAYDPYTIVTGSAERKAITLPGLFRYLSMDLDVAGLDPNDAQCHINLARVVRRLCLRTGLAYYQE